jgi:hypothetical protein
MSNETLCVFMRVCDNNRTRRVHAWLTQKKKLIRIFQASKETQLKQKTHQNEKYNNSKTDADYKNWMKKRTLIQIYNSLFKEKNSFDVPWTKEYFLND